MTKTLSMVSRKNITFLLLSFAIFFISKLITCFIAGVTSRMKSHSIAYFTQWKWTYILNFGPWRWNALNMGFVEKWPSRMQGQWFFLESSKVDRSFWAGLENLVGGRISSSVAHYWDAFSKLYGSKNRCTYSGHRFKCIYSSNSHNHALWRPMKCFWRTAPFFPN